MHMSNVERITVTLTADMAGDVRSAVSAGEYASSSEIVREALRDWRHKRALRQRELEDLRADIRRGIEDAEAGRVRDFVPERIIEKGGRRLARRASSD
jgi:antitoxin ParD1/3/4